jgi:hypothetical protein
MLNYSYTPKWNDLLNFFLKKKDKNIQEIIKNIWCKGDKDHFKLFTRSSWIIFFIIFSKLKDKKNNKEVIVWLPSYYCNDVTYLIKKINVNILYYDINDDFFPNVESLKNISRTSSPDIILYCNYFGRSTFISYLKDLSIKHHALLIEDCTHAMSPTNIIGKHGDIAIYSPYKFFPLPHGAIMVSSKKYLKLNNLNFLLNDIHYDNLIKESLKYINYKKKNNYLFIIIWIIKKFLIKLNLSYSKFEEFSYQEKINNVNFYNYPIIEQYSLKILVKYAKFINKEKEKRLRMFMLWKNFLINIKNISKKNFSFKNYKTDEIPYFFIIGNFQEKINEIFNFLKAKKIPVLSWPNLPDDILNLKSNSNASRLRNNLFFLPLHDQQYDVVNKIVKYEESPNKKILFNEIRDKKIWKQYYIKTYNPSLLQSWDYGEAQSKFYNVQIKRYVLTDLELNKDLAILQVLHRKIFFFNFYRINRGPVFFIDVECNKIEILSSIFHKFKKNSNFSFLSISPEITFNYKNLILNVKGKNIYFKSPSWKSVILNLKIDIELITKQFDSKWRNQLNFSLKEDLIVIENNTIENLKNLINLNSIDAFSRNFKSIDKNFLFNFLKRSDYRIFNAYHNKNLISSICISIHKPGSTYLIGWSNQLGRKKNSTNLLIWNAIAKLKSDHVETFDLGGYDRDVSQGIYNFKIGTGGTNYQLIGNFRYFNHF